MKELSIEEKASKYDEAYKKVAIRFGSNVADEIFSQFEISEDERIRKWIIENIQETLDADGFFKGQKTMAKNAIAWLEKQGEQKQVIDYSDSFPKDNWELIHEFVNKFGRMPKDEDELNVLIEYVLKRHKPAWSEEVQEEQVSEEWIEELKTKLDSMSKEDFKKVFDKYAVDFNEEPVSEDLEDIASQLSQKYFPDEYNIWARPNIEARDCKNACIEMAKWQKENLWKPADGDDLPEYEREVIALEGIVDPTATDCLCGYKVIFAHRPASEGYDRKSLTTGEVEHYTPKTYGEGGWNIPNIVYWLDVELPKEIEL